MSTYFVKISQILQFFCLAKDDVFKLTIPLDDAYSPEQGKSSQKGSQKSSQKIVELLKGNPQITIDQMAAEIGISTRAVKKHLATLRANSIIKRIGPDNGGSWIVITESKKDTE